MPNWIRLDEQQRSVLEHTDTDPKGRFHPQLKWIKAPAGVVAGMHKLPDGSYAYPAPPPEEPVAQAAATAAATAPPASAPEAAPGAPKAAAAVPEAAA